MYYICIVSFLFLLTSLNVIFFQNVSGDSVPTLTFNLTQSLPNNFVFWFTLRMVIFMQNVSWNNVLILTLNYLFIHYIAKLFYSSICSNKYFIQTRFTYMFLCQSNLAISCIYWQQFTPHLGCLSNFSYIFTILTLQQIRMLLMSYVDKDHSGYLTVRYFYTTTYR